ncbi:immunity 53 family protein, partial [bacterium]|nr:immunity 53 family protein [bacterium]
MNVFQQLGDWYMSQCDGDWEHSYGVVIETLDNPGWRIKIDLAETRLSGRFFDAVQINNSETDWIVVEIQEDAFIGHG